MSFLTDVFGEKPKTAPFVPTDLTDEQKKSVQGNISNFGDITQLGDLYHDYLASEFEKSLPGYADILKGGASTTRQMLDEAAPMLRGEIPQDVKDQIQRSTAYKSFMGGFGGSQMSSALTARDLGLTSLDLIGRGANLASQGGNAAQLWSKLAGSTTLDPSSMFTTPAQQAAITARNNEQQQATLQYQYNVDAAPDPVAKGISDTIMSLVGAYLGGGMGGKGGSKGGGQAGVAQYQNFSDYMDSPSSIPYNTSTDWASNATVGSGW